MASSPSGLLDRIVAVKREEVAALAPLDLSAAPLPEMPSFRDALQRPPGASIRVIAECKKKSPSKGVIRNDYNPAFIAAEYARLGASALSVLTDEHFFAGELSHVTRARISGLPIIRKDFIIDPLQIDGARMAGASAVLLIVRILTQDLLANLHAYATSLGMDVLVEVHSEEEAEVALGSGATLIGINHRNLDTLEMDLSLTPRVVPRIRKARPEAILVAESGVESREGRLFVDPYVDALLIGSALMGSDSIADKWREIFN